MPSSYSLTRVIYMCDVVCADTRYDLHSFLWLTGAPHFHMLLVVGVVYHSCSRLCLYAFSDRRDIDAVEFGVCLLI